MEYPPVKERNTTTRGYIGWLAIGGFSAIWNLTSSESLCHAVKRGIDNPQSRPLVIGTILFMSAHLLDIIPTEYDPIDRAGEFIRRQIE